MQRLAVRVQLPALPRDLLSLLQPASHSMRGDQAIDDGRALRFQLFRCLERRYRFFRPFKEDEIPPDEHVRYPKVALNLQSFSALLNALLVLAGAHENFGTVIRKSRNQWFQFMGALIGRQSFFETALRPQEPPAGC